jgi:hypothetical protein
MAKLLTWKANLYQGGYFNHIIVNQVNNLLDHTYSDMVLGEIQKFEEELLFELTNIPDSLTGSPGLTDHDVCITLTDQSNLDVESVPESSEKIYWIGLVQLQQGPKFILLITGISSEPDLYEEYLLYLACLEKGNEE